MKTLFSSALLLVLPLPWLTAATSSYETVYDSARDRSIPLKIYLPEGEGPYPLVFFSHGLGGSREGCAYLGEAWSAAGYVAVFLQHPGSDESVWKEVSRRQRMEAMQEAASGENFQLRVGDIPVVLDRLEIWNASEDHFLSGILDLENIAMAGHSFGAVTAQALAGQLPGRLRRPVFADPRLDAFILMSPSPPNRGDARLAFGSIEKPVLCMTGTRDTSPLREQVTPESRLEVFAALPPGQKYQLNLSDAPHSAFSDESRPGLERDPRYHPAILAITLHFLDSTLKEDSEARAWLESEGVREVLIPEDTWDWK